MKKGDIVWVKNTEKDSWGWEGVVYRAYPYVRHTAGGEYVVIETKEEYPWTYKHVLTSRVLDHKPTADEEGVWDVE